MTALQAKQILLAYRPWTDDARDPEVAAAIAFCGQDAELSKWLEQHCALQISIRDQFRAVAIPDGLKQQIISEHRSLASVPRWRRPAVLTTVGITALLIAVTALWFNLPRTSDQDVSFAAYRNRMVRTAVRIYGMDLETNNVAQIRAYLAQRQAPADYVLPRNLEPAETVGCGALSWQGKPVAMVCFRTGKPLAPGSKSDLFLFVIDQKDLASPPQLDAPVFANVSTLATASWSAGGKVYVLAATDESDLRQRL